MLPGYSIIKEFESLIAKHCEKEYAIATCNASVGILGVFQALGLKCQEIITTPLTWPGAISGLLMLNCKLKFCDVEPYFLTIDPDKIEDLITENTKAVFSADFLGYPCKLDKIQKICQKHNLLLINDSATSFGSYYYGHQSGYYADVSIYSFGRKKLFSIGEGGAIVTENEMIYKKLLNTIAHPERQQIECGEVDTYSLNTTINLLGAEYGLKTYSSQLDNINVRKGKVRNFLNSLANCNPLEDSAPNYYKVLFKPDDIKSFPFEEKNKFEEIPFQKLITEDSFFSEGNLVRCNPVNIAEFAIKEYKVLKI